VKARLFFRRRGPRRSAAGRPAVIIDKPIITP